MKWLKYGMIVVIAGPIASAMGYTFRDGLFYVLMVAIAIYGAACELCGEHSKDEQ